MIFGVLVTMMVFLALYGFIGVFLYVGIFAGFMELFTRVQDYEGVIEGVIGLFVFMVMGYGYSRGCNSIMRWVQRFIITPSYESSCVAISTPTYK
jgi:hypothetical protein